jgi:transposase InsO family protein
MRTFMRRLTRLCLGFSKKLENLKHAVALYFAWYNFVRIHGSLKTTPAVEAGITNRIWTLAELIAA